MTRILLIIGLVWGILGTALIAFENVEDSEMVHKKSIKKFLGISFENYKEYLELSHALKRVRNNNMLSDENPGFSTIRDKIVRKKIPYSRIDWPIESIHFSGNKTSLCGGGENVTYGFRGIAVNECKSDLILWIEDYRHTLRMKIGMFLVFLGFCFEFLAILCDKNKRIS